MIGNLESDKVHDNVFCNLEQSIFLLLAIQYIEI